MDGLMKYDSDTYFRDFCYHQGAVAQSVVPQQEGAGGAADHSVLRLTNYSREQHRKLSAIVAIQYD